jgi:hypothetical protein
LNRIGEINKKCREDREENNVYEEELKERKRYYSVRNNRF